MIAGRHFDIVGDVHGCADELHALLAELGYMPTASGGWRPPDGRALVFIGDLVDRGPQNVNALITAMGMVDDGVALWVPGNHDVQLQRYLEGEDIPLVYGLDGTVAELSTTSREFRDRVCTAIQKLRSHYVLDDGKLVVAHTGLPEALHGAPETADLRHLAAYGSLPGEGEMPVQWSARHAWVAGYTGEAVVVYGHTPRADAEWIGNTIDIDTGCVYGGRLTALRWPERELVSVAPARSYAGPPKLHSRS